MLDNRIWNAIITANRYTRARRGVVVDFQKQSINSHEITFTESSDDRDGGLLCCSPVITSTAQADYIWVGGDAITQAGWQSADSWQLTSTSTFPTGGSGPGTPSSGSWDRVVIYGATGSVTKLEGWNPRITLRGSAELTVNDSNKLQAGSDTDSVIIIENGSTLTYNLNGSGSLERAINVNLDGTFNLVLKRNYTGAGDTDAKRPLVVLNYGYVGGDGAVGSFNASGSGGTRTIQGVKINAKAAKYLSEEAELVTANLGTLTNATITTLSGTLTGYTTFDGDGALTADAANSGKFKLAVDNGNIVLSYVTRGTSGFYTHTGGDLTWDTTTQAFTLNGADAAYADGGNVRFTGTTTSNVTLGEDISAGDVWVKKGAELALTRDGHQFGAQDLYLDGALTLKDSTGSFNIANWHLGESGKVQIGWQGTGACDGLLSSYQGNLAVLSGATLQRTGNATLASLALEDGAKYSQQSGTLTADSAKATGGTVTLDAASVATIRISGSVSGDAAYTLSKTGAGTLEVGAIATDALSGISGINVGGGKMILHGVLTDANIGSITYESGLGRQGYGSDDTFNKGLVLNNVSYAGNFIVESGTVSIGDNQSTKTRLNIGTITVSNGATLRLRNAGIDRAETSLELKDGACLYMHDTSISNDLVNTLNFKTLTLNGDTETAGKKATLAYGWKGTLHFEQLTGAGNLEVVNAFSNAQFRGLSVDSIVNYNGTITDELTANHSFSIGTVHQDTGYAATITVAQAVASESFHKTGGGNISISKLAVSGDFYMSYSGGLSIGTDFDGLTVADGTNLHYTDETGLVKLGAGNLTGVTSLTVNLDEVYSTKLYDGGYNLGITTAYDQANISVSGLSSSDYNLTQGANGYWTITMSNPNAAMWDLRWGASVLAQAPSLDGRALAATENTFLSSNPTYYTETGEGDEAKKVSAIRLTGTNSGTPNVFGGINKSSTNTVTKSSSWILMEGGTYGNLVGGCNATWAGGDYATAFEGDTHIMVKDGSVINIIGGNYQDNKASYFKGDTYISVFGGTVTGNIIGASTAVHNSNTAYFQGDTHIYIYTPLSGDGASLDNDVASSNLIVGGRAHLKNTSTSLDATVNNGIRILGSTNITIDTADKEGVFNKVIIGGNYHAQSDSNMTSYNGSHMLITGDTNVSITSAAGVTYSSPVVAGSYSVDTGLGRDKMEDRINGSTNLTIAGGTFSGVVVGGSYVTKAGNFSITGGSNVNLQGGTFSGAVYGGSYFAADPGTTDGNVQGSMGDIVLNVGGAASLTGDLCGGAFVGAYRNGDSTHAVSVGNIAVTITGGNVSNVYGGSTSSSGGAYITQGAITVDLQGGTIGGNVYAAGNITSTNSTVLTESTTVKIGSGVTFSGTGRIVGGAYSDSRQTGSSATSVGDRTLVFEEAAYSNLSGVTFKDFNIVDVKDATANITLDTFSTTTNSVLTGELTKNGAGKLTINSHGITGTIIANAGEVVINGGSTTIAGLSGTGKVTIGGAVSAYTGNTLSVNGDNSGFTGELTLSCENGVTFADGRSIGGSGTKLILDQANGTGNNGSFWVASADYSIVADIEVKTRGALNGGWSSTYTLEGTLTGDSNSTFQLYTGTVKMTGDVSGFNGLLDVGLATKDVNVHISTALGDSAVVSHIASDTHYGTLALDNTSAIAFGSKVQDKMNLVQAGSGETTFSNTDSTYTGSTSVTDGTLKVTGNIKNTSSVAVSGNGVLEVSGADASVTAGGTKVKAQGETGTVKNVATLDGGHLTGATSGTGADIQSLGEMAGLTLTAAAAMEVSNVTLKQSTIDATDSHATITYRDGVVAIATADKPQTRAAGPAISKADSSSTLTAVAVGTAVQKGGAADGTLTVDIAYSLLDSHRGESITWTIYDGVDITNASLQLGDVLTTLVNNGLPVVSLKVGEDVIKPITAEMLKPDADGHYNLLAGHTGSCVVELTVTNIPEPATGVLSMLALAALAARRRRK